jgi:hypothetical protein
VQEVLLRRRIRYGPQFGAAAQSLQSVNLTTAASLTRLSDDLR